MSKVTRRTVSVRRSSYQRLFAYAQTQGRSCADLIEEMIAKLTGIEPEAARPARRRRVTPTEGAPLKVTPPKPPPPAYVIPEGRNGNGRPAPAPATTSARNGGPRCF